MIRDIQLNYHQVDEGLKSGFERRLSKKYEILKKRLDQYQKPVDFIVRADQPKQSQFKVDLHLVLPFTTISADSLGKELNQALEQAFTSLKENLFQVLDERRTPEQSQMPEPSDAVATLPQMRGAVSTKTQPDFNKAVQPLLNNLSRFIGRRIFYFRQKNRVGEGELTAPPVLNATIEKAKEKYPDKPTEYTFIHWLYHLAEEEIQARIKVLDFEEENVSRWEDQGNHKVEDISERTFFHKDHLHIFDFLPEPDTTSLEWLEYDPMVSKKEVIQVAMEALTRVSETDRQIFDLLAFENLTEEEISNYMAISKDEIHARLGQTRTFLDTEIKKYLNKE